MHLYPLRQRRRHLFLYFSPNREVVGSSVSGFQVQPYIPRPFIPA